MKEVGARLRLSVKTVRRLIYAERRHPGTGLESVKIGDAASQQAPVRVAPGACMSGTSGRRATAAQMSMEELLELPVAVDLRTAARALGITANRAYELVKNDAFPVPVRRYGREWRVSRASIFRELGLDPGMVSRHDERTETRPGGQADGFSGDAARALYDALMAAARVMVERGVVS